MRLIDADKMLTEDKADVNFPYNLDFCDTGDLLEWVNNQPTVDIKTEVAREIFAEIEGLKNRTKLSFNSKKLQDLEKPINSMIRDAIDLILLELKNKYTKEGVGE